MNDYPQGSVKMDPLTGRWAVRTHFSDATPATAPFAWSVADPGGYGSHRSSVEVATWRDLPADKVKEWLAEAKPFTP